MTKALKKIRKIITVCLSIELSVYLLLAAAYFLDIPKGFNNLIETETWIIITSFFLVCDGVLFWYSYNKLSGIKHSTDLSVAKLLGNDVTEAYNFGQIGLVVTDSKGLVLWVSDLFKARTIDLIDTNIFEKLPALNELINARIEATVNVELNGRIYDVKLLQGANLLIFKDSTDYERVCKYSSDQSIVIGNIILDNYNDLSGSEEDNNDVFLKVRQVVLDYAKEHGVLLRKFRNDSYLAVCNYSSLKSMEEDNFSILSSVKATAKASDYIPTLTIGFAYDFPDVNKLSEMASNAIDIGLSRGGDQAVISKYGDELVFYGGNSNAIESTSKIRARSMADSIVSLVKASKEVFIMGHTDYDMDSLGACLGVKAICDWFKVESHIVYDAKLTERKTRDAIESTFNKEEIASIFMSPKDSLDKVKETSAVVICDVSNPQIVMCEELLEKSSKILIIDHHRRGNYFVERPVLSYVEPSASSATELVVELVKYATENPKIEINPRFASIMLSGMFLDTNFFKSKTTGMRTFEAAEELKKFGADNQIADNYLKDGFEEYSTINAAISTLQTPYEGVAFTTLNEDKIIERSMLSKVANQIMQIKGINACFVIGKTSSNEIRMSARSDGTINVQLLTEKMGGGGSFTSAATLYTNVEMTEVINNLLDTLNNNLKIAKVQTEEKGK